MCKCTLCNETIKPVDGAHLRGGRTTCCGCNKMEKMRQAHIKDRTGQTYGFLYAKRMATKEESPKKNYGGTY